MVGWANLSILHVLEYDVPSNVWSACFHVDRGDSSLLTQSMLDARNWNLPCAQKELLLWHHHLFYTSFLTIHNLRRLECATKVLCDRAESPSLSDVPTLPCT